MRTHILLSCACAALVAHGVHARERSHEDRCIEARDIIYRARTVPELYELGLVAPSIIEGVAEALHATRENRILREGNESAFDIAKRLLSESLDDECGADM